MENYEVAINLQSLIEGGYVPEKGDIVFDRRDGGRDYPITLTGTNHPTYPELIGHDTRYESKPVDYHLPKYYWQYRRAVLVQDLFPRLEAAYNAQHDRDFSPIQKLIDELKELMTYSNEY